MQNQGIETEIFHIGNKVIRGCIGCGKCRANKNNRCIFNDDVVNTAIEKAEKADGFIICITGLLCFWKWFYDFLFR